MNYTLCESPIGSIGIVFEGSKLKKVYLPEKTAQLMRTKLKKLYPSAQEAKKNSRVGQQFQRFVQGFFGEELANFDSSLLDLEAMTPFQKKVLKECAKIKKGRTLSYSQLAKRIGKPGASRAVGSALAKNPYPLVIPCHRVTRADQKIGNFSAPRGGLLKKELLQMEKGDRPLLERFY